MDTLEVAFVCTGNRARSPLAAAFFRRRVERLPVRTVSFGTLDLGGLPAIEEARAAGLALGVDLSSHRSQPLRRGVLSSADLVIGFEPFHVSAAVVEGGAESAHTFTILELADLLAAPAARPSDGVEGARRLIDEVGSRRASPAERLSLGSIEDPLGRPRAAYLQLTRQLDDLTGLLAAALFPSAGR